MFTLKRKIYNAAHDFRLRICLHCSGITYLAAIPHIVYRVFQTEWTKIYIFIGAVKKFENIFRKNIICKTHFKDQNSKNDSKIGVSIKNRENVISNIVY